ncbi:hypothetical protein CQW39_31735 [Streptomyces griseofuscus]|nr:hypothetical protein CQW39_31735 [Streptomyces griseofuscus]
MTTSPLESLKQARQAPGWKAQQSARRDELHTLHRALPPVMRTEWLPLVASGVPSVVGEVHDHVTVRVVGGLMETLVRQERRGDKGAEQAGPCMADQHIHALHAVPFR